MVGDGLWGGAWGVGRNCLMTYGCVVWESCVEIGLWIAWGLVAGLLGDLVGGGYGGLQITHIDTRRVCRDFFDNVYGMVVFYVDIAPSFSSLASFESPVDFTQHPPCSTARHLSRCMDRT